MILLKVVTKYLSSNSLYKIIKNFFYYKSYVIFLNRYKYQYRKKNIKAKNIVWIFCTPKSGSTFFMTYLISNLKEYKKISLLPYWKDRHQEMDPVTLSNEINKYPLKKNFFTERHHSRFNHHINNYLSKNHKIIIQTRDIYKTLLSLKDFIDDKLEFSQWFYLDKKIWNTYTDEQKINYLTINYVPWHITFLLSWYYAQVPCEKNFINYKEVVSEPGKILKRILEYKVTDKNISLNKKEVFFKVGLERKNTLTKIQEQKINQIIDENLINHSNEAKNNIYKMINE